MDDIVEDTRREVEVLLAAWETQGPGNGGIFRPRAGEQTMSPRSDNSSDYEISVMGSTEETAARNRVRFVVSDLRGERYKDDDTTEVRALRPSRLGSAVSPGTTQEETGSNGNQYFDLA
jgi:ion channel-forming bestrophin family protein